VAIAVFALAALLVSGRSDGQAISTAGRSAAIFVWGGATLVQPDYGPDYVKNHGYTFGANYDRYTRLLNHPASVGFEFRYGKSTGTVVNESTMAGGLRLGTTFLNRFHPWVNFLFGVGNIDFNQIVDKNDPSYRSDRGRMYEYGFGLDIDVYRNFSVKLDGQQQNWNMGFNQRFPQTNNVFTLAPVAYTAAIVYRIPFRSYIGAQPHRREKVRPERVEPQPSPAVTTTTTTDTTTTTTAPPPAAATPATPPPADNTAPPATPPPADNTTAPATQPAPATSAPATGTSNPPQA
jgi:hypothetical protein